MKPKLAWRPHWVVLFLFGICFQRASVFAADFDDDLDLDDLLNVSVLSAAKKEQSLFDVTAAMSVIDEDFLRKSPASLLPDLMRYTPGMEVNQGNANIWAVSSRGFNNRYSYKLLVLQDGRSIFNTPYSGVFWDSHMFMKDELKAIEIVRGPGGTLWGSNAVNGIINILTKPSWETQGWLVNAGAGDPLEHSIGVRYGGAIGDRLHYRVSGLVESYAGTDQSALGEFDAWDSKTFRMRTDYKADDRNYFMLQANVQQSVSGQASFGVNPQTLLNFIEMSDHTTTQSSLVGKWERLGGADEFSFYLQGSVETLSWDWYIVDDEQKVVSLEFLGRLPWAKGHELSAGVGFRYGQYDESSEVFALAESEQDGGVLHAMLQEEWAITDTVILTAGAKYERHSYGLGSMFQPNARLLWKIGERQRFWVAAAKASRVPSRSELFGGVAPVVSFGPVVLPPALAPGVPPGTALPVVLSFSSNPDMEMETHASLEAGYRFASKNAWSFEIAGFLSEYDHAITYGEPSFEFAMTPFPNLGIVIPVSSSASSSAYGLEASFEWRIDARNTFHLDYSYYSFHSNTLADFSELSLLLGSSDDVAPVINATTPMHKVSGYLLSEFGHGIEAFVGVRWSSKETNQDFRTELDVGLHFEVGEHLRVSLNAQHLLHGERTEYTFIFGEFAVSSPQGRSLDIRASWRY